MPASAALRRSKPSAVVATADTFPQPQTPADTCLPTVTEAFATRPVLRVGDYEVGETFCPRLCGHPGIRY
jgi:hypothetical protein